MVRTSFFDSEPWEVDEMANKEKMALKIIVRSLFCLLGECELCGSPDQAHSCVYICLCENNVDKRICGECLSRQDTANAKVSYFGLLLEPNPISTDDISRMKGIPTTRKDLPNHWDKVVAFKIAAPVLGRWYWIAGADPDYWLNEQ